MKACVLTPGELFAGAERQNLTLMTGLRNLGVPTELAVFFEGELAERARMAGFSVQVFAPSRTLDFACIRRLREYLAADPEMVVSVHGYLASVYLALASGADCAAVKTEHGFVESEFIPWSARMRLGLYRAAENWATRRLRAQVVYVTNDLKARCRREHRGLSGRTIFNGVEPMHSANTRRPAEYDPRWMNLTIVGRVDPVKGIDTAIRALALPTVPAHAHLHVTGSGPQRPELERLAVQLGVADRVSFHGFRANSYDYIAHADTLLMPSLHEGLPYTALEAMALRTPIIASRVGGLAEVLEHERTALLVPAQRPDQLAAAIAQLAASRALADQLRAGAAEDVAQRFSAEVMARQYLRAFEDALAPRTGRNAQGLQGP